MKIYILNSHYPSDEGISAEDVLYRGSLYTTLEGAQIAALEDFTDLRDPSDEDVSLEWAPDGRDCWLAKDEESGVQYAVRLMPVNGETTALRNLVTSGKKLNDTPEDPDIGAAIDAAVDNAELLL